MAKKHEYQDDDGRTIADMSGIEPMPMLFPRFPGKKKQAGAEVPASDRPWETQQQLPDDAAPVELKHDPILQETA